MDKHLLIWESERNQYINHVFPYINDIFVINQVIKFHGSSHHQSDQIHPHLGLCFSHGSMKKWGRHRVGFSFDETWRPVSKKQL